MCAAISRWRICRPCCKKGIGIWLRASQAEWAENPLDKDVELKEFRTSVLGDDELITMLRQEITKLQDENKKQAEEIKKLRGLKFTSADAKRANQLRRSEKIRKIAERNSQLKEEVSADMMTVTNPMRKL